MLPELSNFYCHPGRAGGTPGWIRLLVIGVPEAPCAAAPIAILKTPEARDLSRYWSVISTNSPGFSDRPLMVSPLTVIPEVLEETVLPLPFRTVRFDVVKDELSSLR
jgi:hypothetical protein